MKKKNIVLFDFDGTLSAKDSVTEFWKYCFRHSVRPWFFLPAVISAGFVFIIAKIIPRKNKYELGRAGCLWRRLSRMFFTEKLIERLVPGFIRQHKCERFGWAKEQVQKEHDAGNIVICISASADYLIPKLVDDMAFDVIITTETFKDCPWKSKFICWGNNKVRMLNQWALDNKIIPHVVRAYSDSPTDTPMMNLADEQVWIDAKTGLRRNVEV